LTLLQAASTSPQAASTSLRASLTLLQAFLVAGVLRESAVYCYCIFVVDVGIFFGNGCLLVAV
jgi:hypothetical protein